MDFLDRRPRAKASSARVAKVGRTKRRHLKLAPRAGGRSLRREAGTFQAQRLDFHRNDFSDNEHGAAF